MSRRRLLTVAFVLVIAGCATASPRTIVVAAKDVQARFESRDVGYTDSPLTRRTVPVVRDEIVRTYWVKGTDGTWYPIEKSTWEAAKVGEPLEIRPALPERQSIWSGSSMFPCTGPDHRWRC